MTCLGTGGTWLAWESHVHHLDGLGNEQDSCAELLLPYLLILVSEEQKGRPCSACIRLRPEMVRTATGLDISQLRTCVKAKAIDFHRLHSSSDLKERLKLNAQAAPSADSLLVHGIYHCTQSSYYSSV